MRRRYAPRLPPPLSPLRGARQATRAPLPRRHCRRCAAMAHSSRGFNKVGIR